MSGGLGLAALNAAQMRCLPSTTLTALSNTIAANKSKMLSTAAELQTRLNKLEGLGTFSLESGGKSVVDGFASLSKVRGALDEMSQPVNSTARLLQGALEDPNTASPFTDPNFATNSDVQGLLSNLDEFNESTFTSLKSGPFADQIELLKSHLFAVTAEIESLNQVQNAISDIIQNRVDGTDTEPELNLDWVEPDSFMEEMAERFAKFVQDNIIFPFDENQALFNRFALESQLTVGTEEPPLFDLEYGPPVSTKGQFILSEDGLYYDSRKGGIPEVSGFVAASSTWNLGFAPNLGGKGQMYTQDDFEEITNTIFDENILQSNEYVARLFDTDDVLESFDNDKSRHIGLVSGQIEELRGKGETALANQYFGSVGAIAAAYDVKLRKRRKQLQLAGTYGTNKYQLTDSAGNVEFVIEGTTVVYPTGLGEGVVVQRGGTTSEPIFEILERIPINDFSFLRGSGVNVSLQSQQDLVIVSEDLEDSILPLRPVFHVSQAKPFSVLHNFEIESIASQDFLSINDSSGGQGASGTGPFIKSLVDSVVKDGLVLNYNFIDPNVVTPSSTLMNLENVAPEIYGKLDGQLVGSSIGYVFPSGVSIPRLQGAAFNPSGLLLPTATTSGGSYVRIPNTNNTLNSITHESQYDKLTGFGGGFSFDFWAHVPDVSSITNEHRYKLILANENSGGDVVTSPAGTLGGTQSFVNAKRTTFLGDQVKTTDFSKTHGMVMGWRDRGGSTAPSGLEFFVAPTVSNNANTGMFGHSVCIAESSPSETPAAGTTTELGVYVASSVSTSTKSRDITDVNNQFCHYAVVFNYVDNLVSIYLDGEVLKTSVLDSSFDLPAGESLNIPSLTKPMSTSPGAFYEGSYNPGVNVGPRVGDDSVLGSTFTPWIIGGGYTDSIPQCMVNHQGIAMGGNDPGFLGYNTNDTYYQGPRAAGGLVGQHGYSNTSAPSNALSIGGNIARAQSGLDGYVGSFKIYRKALTTSEVVQNYDAQQAYFKNISV